MVTSIVLTCPSCRTRFQSDAARFVPNGKNVRCGKCGQVWFQPPPVMEPVPEIALPATPEIRHAPPLTSDLDDDPSADFGEERMPADIPPKPEEKIVKRRANRIHLAQVAGWAVLLIMVVGIGWSGVQYRQFIANVWPESAFMYAFFGMPVNVRGMALVDIAYKQDIEDGQPVLSVSGKVVNISNHELPVPGLRAVLTDDTLREIYRWTFNVGVPTLKAGAESDFTTRLSSPPPAARNLNITFADSDG